MSRNGYVDYMDVTGYLPRIERDKAVCWRGEQLYIKGDACYPNAPKYLTEDETRRYMANRFGYKMVDMQAKNFDYNVAPDMADKQRDALTITDSGRFLYQEGTPISQMPGNISETVVKDFNGLHVETLKTPAPGDISELVNESGITKVGTGVNSLPAVAKGKEQLKNLPLLVVAVCAPIGYLLFVKGRRNG